MSGTYEGLRLASLANKDPDEELPDDNDAVEKKKPKSKSKKEDEEMNEEETNALKAEAKAEGFKEANARMNAVFASDEYAGREKLAQSLLATSLSAEEINVQLAAAPKIEPSAIADTVISQEAADEAARKVMQESISQTANAAIDLGGGDGDAPAAIEANVMKSAAAKANKINGL